MSTSFPLDSMRVRFAGDTHVGMTRTHNEDALHLPVDERLAIVADGMGGHASGEVASRMAVDTVVEYFKETAEEQVLTWPFKVDRHGGADLTRLVTAIKLANVKIHEQAQRDPACKGMGTTIVSALFRDDGIIVGHVGDSRVYRVRDGGITQITEDHSLINDYIKMKRMTAEEASSWPHKNVIVRALGMKESVQVDVRTDEPRLGDCYLLCSDGLSGMISDETILEIVLGERDLDRAAEQLIAAANNAGGKDNITVVYVEAPAFARDVAGAPVRARSSAVTRGARWVVRSRTTWFALGALAGVLGLLLWLWRTVPAPPVGPRTLIVTQSGTPGAFGRITDALSAARSGDTVQLEPGVYAEQVSVPEGVDLVGRVPGTVRFVRDGTAAGEWISISAAGASAARISGIRIESTREAPVDVGIRAAGQGMRLDLLELSGPMRSGIELLAPGAVSIRGSLLAIDGTAVSIGDGAHAAISNTVFFRTGPPAPPIAVAGAARPSLSRNVFAGFGADIIKGISADERRQLLGDNFIVAAEPWRLR